MRRISPIQFGASGAEQSNALRRPLAAAHVTEGWKIKRFDGSNGAGADVIEPDRLPVLPGISLMSFRQTTSGLELSCPGCCAEHVVPVDGDIPAFEHADRACPVLRTVNAALEAFGADDVQVRA